MAGTATLLKGPSVVGEWHEAIFQVLLDNSIADGLVTVDLTAYFSEIDCAWPCGFETAAENLYGLSTVVPDFGVALTATNFGITAFWATGDAGVNVLVTDSTQLSALAQLRLCVRGKYIL